MVLASAKALERLLPSLVSLAASSLTNAGSGYTTAPDHFLLGRRRHWRCRDGRTHYDNGNATEVHPRAF